MLTLTLAGCGSWHYTQSETPKQAIKNYDVLEIHDFTTELDDQNAKELAFHFANALHEKILEDRAPIPTPTPRAGPRIPSPSPEVVPVHTVFKEIVRSTDRTDKVLVLEGVIISFDMGSRAKRYWVGFGAGAALCTIQSTFKDKATGEVIERVNFDGKHMGGGAFGGSDAEVKQWLSDWLVRAYIDFFRDHFAEGKPSSGSPGAP